LASGLGVAYGQIAFLRLSGLIEQLEKKARQESILLIRIWQISRVADKFLSFKILHCLAMKAR
jgi:hypothetical protein